MGKSTDETVGFPLPCLMIRGYVILRYFTKGVITNRDNRDKQHTEFHHFMNWE